MMEQKQEVLIEINNFTGKGIQKNKLKLIKTFISSLEGYEIEEIKGEFPRHFLVTGINFKLKTDSLKRTYFLLMNYLAAIIEKMPITPVRRGEWFTYKVKDYGFTLNKKSDGHWENINVTI